MGGGKRKRGGSVGWKRKSGGGDVWKKKILAREAKNPNAVLMGSTIYMYEEFSDSCSDEAPPKNIDSQAAAAAAAAAAASTPLVTAASTPAGPLCSTMSTSFKPNAVELTRSVCRARETLRGSSSEKASPAVAASSPLLTSSSKASPAASTPAGPLDFSSEKASPAAAPPNTRPRPRPRSR